MLALAVDIGGTRTKLALVDPQGQLASEVLSFPTPVAEGLEAFQENLQTQARTLLRQAAEVGERVVGVGVSTTGILDEGRSRIRYHPNNPVLEGFAPGETLAREDPSLAVEVEMDYHAPALAEYHWGAGQGVERLLTVVVGTGVGAGLLVKGEPLRITLGGIGDPGFIVVNPWGWPAPHGGHGSLEAEAAAPSLPHWFREREIASRQQALREAARRGTLRPEEVIEAARQGDAAALWALRQAGGRLGMGLASLSVIFKPQKILVVGGMVEAGEAWWQAVQEAYHYHCPPFYREGVEVAQGRFGPLAPLIGAAAVLFRRVAPATLEGR